MGRRSSVQNTKTFETDDTHVGLTLGCLLILGARLGAGVGSRLTLGTSLGQSVELLGAAEVLGA